MNSVCGLAQEGVAFGKMQDTEKRCLEQNEFDENQEGHLKSP